MENFEILKCQKLADEIANSLNLTPALYEAFCKVPRSVFVPISAYAYELNPQPILGGQWISSPLTVAKMSLALELDGADKVLEIGCGSGYQAAILSKIIRRVFTIERIEKLVNEAKKNFESLNITNVHLRYDDGNAGWKKYAPYERILLSAAAKEIDKRLLDQLEVGGILVAPLYKDGCQKIVKIRKISELDFNQEIIDECEFVPLLKGVEQCK
ncbi:protein-L-isoaspartate(D-aspartate) O-methyltransferase [Campylobacter ureolyticus]|uniref:Protein-L-isoaspartate O-methyltransferase n=1 Tax=Campylobacter ureolyticus TaxID=827 RepID=A0A6N2S7K2_9BACT